MTARFICALVLGCAFAAPIPAGASTVSAITKITIRNDTPNPAFVVFDFLTIPNDKAGGWADANGGTQFANHSASNLFLTHVHVYIKPEGQQSEHAPTICYVGASYVNSFVGGSGVGHFKMSLHYDAQHNTCWLENF